MAKEKKIQEQDDREKAAMDADLFLVKSDGRENLMPEAPKHEKSIPVILILAGILVLLVDVGINTGIRYPEYVMLEAYGTSIQQMVMGQVVGNYVQLDLVSDVVGFVLLAVGCGMMIRPAEPFRNGKNFKLGLGFAAGGLVFYLIRLFMPYLFKGAVLYGCEYAIHFVIAGAESFATWYAVSAIVALCERAESHWQAVITEIFMMVASICGFICGMGAFYQIGYVKWTYLLAQYILTLLVGLLLLRIKRYWLQGYRKTELPPV